MVSKNSGEFDRISKGVLFAAYIGKKHNIRSISCAVRAATPLLGRDDTATNSILTRLDPLAQSLLLGSAKSVELLKKLLSFQNWTSQISILTKKLLNLQDGFTQFRKLVRSFWSSTMMKTRGFPDKY